MHRWFRRNFRQLAGMPFPNEELEKWPRWVPWIAAVLSAVSWVLFVGAMSESGNRAEAIVARSKPTTGTIVEFTDNEARQLREAVIRYRAGAEQLEEKVSVANRKLSEGDTIQLRYDPQDTAVVFEAGDRQPPGGEVSGAAGIAFVGGSIFGLGAAFVWATQHRAARVRRLLAAKAAAAETAAAETAGK